MTDKLDKIRERQELHGTQTCKACRCGWPCPLGDIAYLLALVNEQAGELKRSEAAALEVLEGSLGEIDRLRALLDEARDVLERILAESAPALSHDAFGEADDLVLRLQRMGGDNG